MMVFLMASRQIENRIDIQFSRTLPQKLTRTSKHSAYFDCQVVLNEPGPTRVVSPIATDGDDASLNNKTYLIVIIHTSELRLFGTGRFVCSFLVSSNFFSSCRILSCQHQNITVNIIRHYIEVRWIF